MAISAMPITIKASSNLRKEAPLPSWLHLLAAANIAGGITAKELSAMLTLFCIGYGPVAPAPEPDIEVGSGWISIQLTAPPQ